MTKKKKKKKKKEQNEPEPESESESAVPDMAEGDNEEETALPKSPIVPEETEAAQGASTDLQGKVHIQLHHCAPRAPVREVSSRVYLFAYGLNPHNTMHFTQFRQLSLYVVLRQWWNRVNCIVL